MSATGPNTRNALLEQPASVPEAIVTGASTAPIEAAQRIAARYRMSVADALALVVLGISAPNGDRE